MGQRKKIPGPSLLIVLARLLNRRRQMQLALLDMVKEHCNISQFALGKRYVVVLSHPEDIQYILKDAPERFLKSKNYEFLRPVLGDGLLTSEKEVWHRQRKMIQPIFHRRTLQRFSEDMLQATQKMLGSWEEH